MIRVGDRLREERTRQGYTLADVAKATKIRERFLRGIEEGDYSTLPSVTYIQGFVKNYIEFLGLPQKELMALFRREFDEKEHIGVLPENLTAKKEISLNRLRVRQAVVLGVTVLVGILLYMFIQYRQAFFSPSLTILAPQEHATITTQTISVSGDTEPNASVTVNDIPVVVDQAGNFTKEITVFSGVATITVKSTNSFGKVSTVERHITVK